MTSTVGSKKQHFLVGDAGKSIEEIGNDADKAIVVFQRPKEMDKKSEIHETPGRDLRVFCFWKNPQDSKKVVDSRQ